MINNTSRSDSISLKLKIDLLLDCGSARADQSYCHFESYSLVLIVSLVIRLTKYLVAR